RCADLNKMTELAHGEHQQLLQLLAPDAAKQLDPAKRSKLTHEALSHNIGRMPRLQELIAAEVAQLDDQAKQLAARTGEPASPAAGAAPPPAPPHHPRPPQAQD